MAAFAEALRTGFANADAAVASPASQREDLLLNLVRFACQAFDVFQRIHPYANGNGHVARFLIWSVLGKYNFWPRRFTIEPRPNEPRFIELIVRHRNGDREPLVEFVLSQLQ